MFQMWGGRGGRVLEWWGSGRKRDAGPSALWTWVARTTLSGQGHYRLSKMLRCPKSKGVLIKAHERLWEISRTAGPLPCSSYARCAVRLLAGPLVEVREARLPQ